MKTNSEIRAEARDAFQAQYWKAVGVNALIKAIRLALGGSATVFLIWRWIITGDIMNAFIASTVGINFGWFNYLLMIFIGMVLFTGLRGFFLCVSRRTEAYPAKAFVVFNRYGRVLGGSLWVWLWTVLWTLLFIVPGIVKTLEYFCAHYILADSPNVQAMDAIELSKRIMPGYKAKLFGLILSFIGWGILSVLTCGVLGVFYTEPYFQSALAIFYDDVKAAAIAESRVYAAEFADR